MTDKKTEFIEYLKGRFEVVRKDSDEVSVRGYCKAIEKEISEFLEGN